MCSVATVVACAIARDRHRWSPRNRHDFHLKRERRQLKLWLIFKTVARFYEALCLSALQYVLERALPGLAVPRRGISSKNRSTKVLSRVS